MLIEAHLVPDELGSGFRCEIDWPCSASREIGGCSLQSFESCRVPYFWKKKKRGTSQSTLCIKKRTHRLKLVENLATSPSSQTSPHPFRIAPFFLDLPPSSASRFRFVLVLHSSVACLVRPTRTVGMPNVSTSASFGPASTQMPRSVNSLNGIMWTPAGATGKGGNLMKGPSTGLTKFALVVAAMVV
jgi:hypothetical protein